MPRDRGQTGRSACTRTFTWGMAGGANLPHDSKAWIAHTRVRNVRRPCSCCTRGTGNRLLSADARLCCRARRNSSHCRCRFDVSRSHNARKIVAKRPSSLLLHALTTSEGVRDWVASSSEVSRLYSSVRSLCKSCDMLIDSSCCGTVGLHSRAKCPIFLHSLH